jgi:hypothetical protein
MARGSSTTGRKQVQLPRISDETRLLSAHLEQELMSWPDVSAKPMFGMVALYRGQRIFAALPRTRAMETACSVSFKLPRPSRTMKDELARDSRVVRAERSMENWISFEVRSPRDVTDALEWFGRAYRQAAKQAD